MIDSIQHFSHLTGAPVYQFTGRKGLLKDGCTIVYQGIYLVLYNVSEINQQRLNWTLAHEIGHIYLEHQTDGALQEVEAVSYTHLDVYKRQHRNTSSIKPVWISAALRE